jgi:hypothetical protein
VSIFRNDWVAASYERSSTSPTPPGVHAQFDRVVNALDANLPIAPAAPGRGPQQPARFAAMPREV